MKQNAREGFMYLIGGGEINLLIIVFKLSFIWSKPFPFYPSSDIPSLIKARVLMAFAGKLIYWNTDALWVLSSGTFPVCLNPGFRFYWHFVGRAVFGALPYLSMFPDTFSSMVLCVLSFKKERVILNRKAFTNTDGGLILRCQAE